MEFKMSNKVYDIIKYAITIFIPAAVVFFNLLAKTWHWDLPLAEINATIEGFVLFIGAILGISNAYYKNKKEE